MITTRVIKRSLPILLLLIGCVEMIRPEDPEYLDSCVVYVEADGWIDIQPWMLENCYSIRLWVIR
jgi:hypothetical protein